MHVSPALMDCLVFFVPFAVFYAAGARGVGMAECAWLGILFQAAYITGGFVLGDAWMRHSGSPTDMYLVCAAGLAASVAAQMTIVFVKRKPQILLPSNHHL